MLVGPGFVLAIGATETKIQIFSSPSTSQINVRCSLPTPSHRNAAFNIARSTVHKVPFTRRTHRLGPSTLLHHSSTYRISLDFFSRLRHLTRRSSPRFRFSRQLHSSLAILSYLFKCHYINNRRGPISCSRRRTSSQSLRFHSRRRHRSYLFRLSRISSPRSRRLGNRSSLGTLNTLLPNTPTPFFLRRSFNDLLDSFRFYNLLNLDFNHAIRRILF